MTHTVTDFVALMTQFNVLTDTRSAVGSTGYHDSPVLNQLFQGTDAGNRVYVNVPLTLAGSPVVEAEIAEYAQPEDEDWHHGAFVVFQRYSDHTAWFSMGGADIEPMTIHDFLGQHLNDLTNLETLLSGTPLRFHYTKYVNRIPVNDTDRWIEIMLRRDET
jgi:hypothetical protein